MRIAVIGTGIAGNGAAWLLDTCHDVTVYEQNAHIGGHANTVDAPAPVDIGFIVYNTATYPNLCALFDHLGVPTRPSTMSFAVSLDSGRLEYAGKGLPGLFAQPRNLFRPDHWRMLRDIVRFYREAPALLGDPRNAVLTLRDYLVMGGYGDAFIHDHLLPMGAAIWSAPPAEMLGFPAISFVRFCHNHGLLKLKDRPPWRTVTGGSRAYVERLTAGFRARIRTSCPVTAIRRTGDGVLVRDALGGIERFDHAVIATHADQALALLTDPSHAETDLLGRFRYQANRAILHRDPALMPRRRSVWSSWNYLGRRARSDRAAVSVTYWMNQLQGLDPANPLFVTLNPLTEPRPDLKIIETVYDHPVFDAAAIAAQTRIAAIQGVRSTWFCGGWLRYGFHEDALSSGLAVAEALGARRPWAVTESSPVGRNARPAVLHPVPA